METAIWILACIAISFAAGCVINKQKKEIKAWQDKASRLATKGTHMEVEHAAAIGEKNKEIKFLREHLTQQSQDMQVLQKLATKK